MDALPLGAGKYNKLVTKDELDTKQNELTFDDTPTEGSSNPVTSNGIKEAIDNATPNLQYDNLPTYNSEKLVKSGRIYAALGNRRELVYETGEPTSTSNRIVTSRSAYAYVNPIKLDVADIKSYIPSGTNSTDNKLVNQSDISNFQTELEFDTTPTDGSTNPVESNGIYDAIKVVKDDVDDINELIPEGTSSENKLADKAYVDKKVGDSATNIGQTITNVNNTLTQHIADTNVHLSSGQIEDIAKIDDIDDTVYVIKKEISLAASESNKLIDKKYVDDKLDEKQNTLDFDSTPTQGSENPVTSGGVYTDIQGVKDKIPASASASNKLVDIKFFGEKLKLK